MNAYIWDLDGTLLDSYTVIVSSILETCRAFGIPADYKTAHKAVIQSSVTAFLETLADGSGVPYKELQARYSEVSGRKKGEISLIPHANETLAALKRQGARHFVYTHRGKTTMPVLNQLGLEGCFDEIITSEAGFPRKPAPDALLYLMERHKLDPKTTFYVGDRTIDMDCARNAGIQGILFLPEGSYCTPNGSQSRSIRDLRDLL